jgi:hypothetical protein
MSRVFNARPGGGIRPPNCYCQQQYMTAKRKTWLLTIAVVLAIGILSLSIVARRMSARVEPYIRDQAVQYLKRRFDSEVEIGSLRISIPKLSPLRLLARDLHGASARVEAENVVLRHKGRRDIPPMFVMKEFAFEVDLGILFDSPKRVPIVTVNGMEITVPPKGDRPDLGAEAEEDQAAESTDVIFDEVVIKNSVLTLLPRDTSKHPLRFDLHEIRLQSAGRSVAMTYHASMAIPKPPGEILAEGSFGPWAAAEPGDSPLNGDYVFRNADLGVFKSIAGKLDSTGHFEGTLDSVTAKGQADVPDFRLKRAANVVPLKTRFEVLVDGTNGNVILKPVVGTLGATSFVTSGGIVKHGGDAHRTISLDVEMPKGRLRDLMGLAMKGIPLMDGKIALKAKIDIPPLDGKVKEKLLLDGRFDISDGKFLRANIQDQIDMLSRRGQGQPKNMEIDDVVLAMGGQFTMEDQLITFKSLSFAVPGSGVDLAGTYDVDDDVLDLHGTLKLQAKVSQTMTGWKHWLLKPVDPFFSKNGAGTFLHIQVVGSSKEPKFGRDKGDKGDKAPKEAE